MASDQTIRASDRDRDAVVDALRDAYISGRLTLEEFHERTAAAYDGRTWGDLRELTKDLPVQPVLGADIPGHGTLEVPDPDAAPSLPDSPRPPIRRDHSGMLVPFIMLWLLSAVVTRSPAAVAAPVIILALVILVSGIFRRR